VCGAVPTLAPGELAEQDVLYLLRWLLVGLWPDGAQGSVCPAGIARCPCFVCPATPLPTPNHPQHHTLTHLRTHTHPPTHTARTPSRRVRKAGCLQGQMVPHWQVRCRRRVWRLCAAWREATCGSLQLQPQL
jgi:hypothetical protein